MGYANFIEREKAAAVREATEPLYRENDLLRARVKDLEALLTIVDKVRVSTNGDSTEPVELTLDELAALINHLSAPEPPHPDSDCITALEKFMATYGPAVDPDAREGKGIVGMSASARDREFDEPTRIGAAELLRLRRPVVGADTQNPGCYEIAFLDEDDKVVRSIGRFRSPKAAANAVPFIQAGAVLEEVGAAGWCP